MRDTRVEPEGDETPVVSQPIRVRYWAAARTAAGCDSEDIAALGPMSLADVVAEVLRRHPGTRLPEVIGVCSVLLGDRPVATEDPASVGVAPGTSVEFLPPFAGG
jgi:molybdopterin synthase sulfur carrier subunit